MLRQVTERKQVSDNEHETFLKVPDVARLLRCTEASVRQMTHRKRLPFRRVGRRLFFVRDEIVRMVVQSPGLRLEELDTTSKDLQPKLHVPRSNGKESQRNA